MSESIAELRDTPSASAKRDSRAVEFKSLRCSGKKERKAQSSDNEGSDVDALINDSSGVSQRQSQPNQSKAIMAMKKMNFSQHKPLSTQAKTRLVVPYQRSWPT